MNKLLLVIPENSYKSNDFVLTAERLDIDFLVITDSDQVSSQFGDTVIIQNFNEKISDETLLKLKKITHVLPVDHSALKFAGYLVDLLDAKGNISFSLLNGKKPGTFLEDTTSDDVALVLDPVNLSITLESFEQLIYD